ncbi:MAG: SelB C-terminal domain-containing protein, partial [Bryobacteraceae bacterium]|nr:SelB C-terminal domain-containing protein [Bryobacteraceae bacterium]
TIGGGEVVDPFPPQKLRMADSLQRVRALSGAPLPARINFLVGENRDGLSLAELAIRTGESERNLLAAMPPGVSSVPGPQTWIVSNTRAAETVSAWRERLTQFHLDHPLVPGIPREDFRSRYFPDAPVFVFDYLLTLEPAVRSTAEFLHLATHRLALKEDEERALASIEAAFGEAGLSVPGVEAVLASSGVDRTRARNLLQVLLRQKRLLRVSDDLVFHPTALQSLRQLLQAKTGVRFAVGDFKDWTGVSRKYAIPLLEYFDRERVTRREGESRVVLLHSK